MTLDEAIIQAERIAKRQEMLSRIHPGKKEEEDCRRCAEEHRQLAEWLRELKERRAY